MTERQKGQSELFDIGESGVRRTSFFKKKYDRSLTVSVENAIIGVIVFVVAVSISFIAGVEKGKRNVPGAAAGGPAAGSPRAVEKQIPVPPPAVQGARVENAKVQPPGINPGTLAKAPDNAAVPEHPPAPPAASSGRYTIQLVTYKGGKSADKEMKKLKSAGYDAFVLLDRKYYKVCAGSYEDKKSAAGDMAKFRKKEGYRDCFLRLKKG